MKQIVILGSTGSIGLSALDVIDSLGAGYEVLAITGLVGARRTEVCEAIYGISAYDSGPVTLEGRTLNRLIPTQAIADGIGFLPEDRLKQGLVLRWEIAKNISLPIPDKFARLGWLDTPQLAVEHWGF